MKQKTRATGIIVEYNPFHNGHQYHLQQTKLISEGDVLIAVMSPHFVQRGEPAILDKWERTQIALEQGVDLVVELPTHLTLQSAEIFAKYSLTLLSLLKVDELVYGAESLDKPTLQTLDKNLLKKGYSYAKAKNTLAYQPNQILGAYYEKYAQKYHIKTQRILREVSYHDETLHSHIASASAIRKAHFEGLNTHSQTPLDLRLFDTTQIELAYPLIRYAIISQKEHLNNYLLVDEGIENLLYKLALKHTRYEDFIQEATSKRYTKSRIQRTLCHILLQTPKEIKPLNSVRILGMNKKGQAYLKEIKNDAPIVTSFKHYQFKDLETKATQLYALINPKKNPLIEKEAGPILIY